MNQTLRSFAAGAAGALLVTAVVASQPALADQLDKAAAKNSVTSKSIKDGAIKTKDLNAEVTGPLAKAATALQSIPDNGVTTGKLADNAVTNPKLADNAVGSTEVAPDSLGAGDLAAGSVGASEVANGSLSSSDLTTYFGNVDLTIATLVAGACQTQTINPSPATANTSLADDLITVSPGFGFASGLMLQAHPTAALGDDISVTICNVTGATVPGAAVDVGWGVIESD
jgi:hypothetical protein